MFKCLKAFYNLAQACTILIDPPSDYDQTKVLSLKAKKLTSGSQIGELSLSPEHFILR